MLVSVESVEINVTFLCQILAASEGITSDILIGSQSKREELKEALKLIEAARGSYMPRLMTK